MLQSFPFRHTDVIITTCMQLKRQRWQSLFEPFAAEEAKNSFCSSGSLQNKNCVAVTAESNACRGCNSCLVLLSRCLRLFSVKAVEEEEKMPRAVVPSVLTGEPLDSYKLVTREIPKASPGNVVVRMVLSPVNPVDLLVLRMGTWQGLDPDTSTVGSEGVGLVHELGEGVTNFKNGQRVVPLIFHRYELEGYGLWRDYVEIPARDLVPVPDDISDEYAAQFFMNPWCIYQMLKQLDIPKGEYIIQGAAASVLGRQLITLARHWGIKSINIVRRDSQIQELKDLGADYVLNSEKEDIVARVNEITGGKKAWGALDPLGEMTNILFASVSDGGKVLVFGALPGTDIQLSMNDLRRGVQLKAFSVDNLGHDLAKREETSKEIFELTRQKVLAPLSGKKFPLEKVKEAIIEANKPGRCGQIFLESYNRASESGTHNRY